jgi:hypothetical protein
MVRRTLGFSFFVLLVAGTYLARPACAAGWKEPADRKLTEDQVKVYLATENDWLDVTYKIARDVESAKTHDQRISAVQGMDQRTQAVLDKHHVSKEEFSWVGNRVLEAWGLAVYVYDVQNKAREEINNHVKENDQKLAQAKQRLADYQAAQKDGRRVMSREDRDAAIKSARNDQQAALDDAREHVDEAKTAAGEATQHDNEATAADALAAKPPANVSADERQGYIDGKKAEAQTDRDAARESRDRLAEANKAKADADGKATIAAEKASNPDIPVTDNEKASVKAENEAAITQAQNDINGFQQAQTQMTMLEVQLKKNIEETTKDIPRENIDLMHKYADQYKEMFERPARGAPSTQPSKS